MKQLTAKQKENRKIYHKKWRDANPDKIKKQYQKNKEKNKARANKWRKDNPEKKKEQDRQYRKNNPEKVKKGKKKYVEAHPERVKKSKIKYRNANLEQERERTKNWHKDNPNYINEYVKKRKLVDPVFKLSYNIRNMVCEAIKKGHYSKKSKSQEILGCSFEELKKHLESKFEPWMNWNNHGKYNKELNFGWDIDHIIPLSSAKTENEILKLCHFSNLQPLCSRVNRDIKRANF